jgi:colicin import membrane protein
MWIVGRTVDEKIRARLERLNRLRDAALAEDRELSPDERAVFDALAPELYALLEDREQIIRARDAARAELDAQARAARDAEQTRRRQDTRAAEEARRRAAADARARRRRAAAVREHVAVEEAVAAAHLAAELAPRLPVPVVERPAPPASGDHLLAVDVELRARSVESWAPWGRRRTTRSRRYEGFERPRRD